MQDAKTARHQEVHTWRAHHVGESFDQELEVGPAYGGVVLGRSRVLWTGIMFIELLGSEKHVPGPWSGGKD